MTNPRSGRWSSAGSRARRFPLLGALVALGSPLGLLVSRAIRAGSIFDVTFYIAELGKHLDTYAYLAVSTILVLVIIGRRLGKSQDKLVNDSLKDAVTGLANRRQFDRAIFLELDRSKRYGFAVTLMMIDVDRLKLINDRGGHQAGDAALKLVASCIRATCRTTDLPARFGGDEFIVMAPHTVSSEAAELGKRLLEVLRASPLEHVGCVTVSIGIVDTTDIASDADSAALVEAADRALYQAKNDGRGVVRLASPPMSQPKLNQADMGHA